jgi:hypothetical protein
MTFSACYKSVEEINQLTRAIEESRIHYSYLNLTQKYNDKENESKLMMINTIKIVLYLIMMAISLSGNVLLIMVIIFNRFMRKATNYFILNLAICDLAILFSCVWVQIAMTINQHWTLGKLFCKLNSFMQVVSVVASVLTLALISCDRYYGVIYPLKARITSKRSYVFIGSIWLLAVLIALPSFVYRTYTERKWLDFTELHCDDLGWPTSYVKDNINGCVTITRPSKRVYYTAIILLLFFLPIFIMSITYSIIIYKMWKSEVLGERVSEDKKNMFRRKKKVKYFFLFSLPF